MKLSNLFSCLICGTVLPVELSNPLNSLTCKTVLLVALSYLLNCLTCKTFLPVLSEIVLYVELELSYLWKLCYL